MYNEKVMETFKNPKNMGEIENADGIGKVGNPTCGDLMQVTIKVKDNKIEDIKVKTFGCVAAIVTSSIMTEIVKGKTLEEAEKLTKDDIIEALGDLPPIKKHCSVLAHDGLIKAIEDYRSKA